MIIFQFCQLRSRWMACALLCFVWGISLIVCSPPWFVDEWRISFGSKGSSSSSSSSISSSPSSSSLPRSASPPFSSSSSASFTQSVSRKMAMRRTLREMVSPFAGAYQCQTMKQFIKQTLWKCLPTFRCLSDERFLSYLQRLRFLLHTIGGEFIVSRFTLHSPINFISRWCCLSISKYFGSLRSGKDWSGKEWALVDCQDELKRRNWKGANGAQPQITHDGSEWDKIGVQFLPRKLATIIDEKLT